MRTKYRRKKPALSSAPVLKSPDSIIEIHHYLYCPEWNPEYRDESYDPKDKCPYWPHRYTEEPVNEKP